MSIYTNNLCEKKTKPIFCCCKIENMQSDKTIMSFIEVLGCFLVKKPEIQNKVISKLFLN